MRAQLDTYINMLRTVAKLYQENQARFDVIPVLVEKFITYNEGVDKLEKWLTIALSDPEQNTKGVAKLKTALAEAAEAVALPVGAYADAAGLSDLKNTMNVRASSLVKEKKDRLPTLCQTIYDEAKKVEAEAAPYSLTKEELDTLKAAIPAYKTVANTPRLEHGEVKTSNKEIAKIVDKLLALLKEQIDRIVAKFKKTDSSLYEMWTVARKLVNPPSKTTTLILTILASDRTPIAQAKAVVKNDKKEVSLLSDHQGVALFKPAPIGMVSVTVTLEGYQPYSNTSLKLKPGSETALEVLLENILEGKDGI